MSLKKIWTPQMEAQLLAWHQQHQAVDPVQPAPCITLSREFGCQGYPVAEALVKLLNVRAAGEPWIVVGRQIIDEVAELSGYTVEQIEKSQDTSATLKAIFSMFLDRSRAEETEVFAYMRTVIRGFARRGKCVLVGRGGVLAVQDLPNCINLRLVAPLAFRIQQIMKTHNLSEPDAGKYIALHQQQRDDFIHRFGSGNIADPTLYHLVVNNAHLDVVDIAALADQYLSRYNLN
ncbi:MAG: cytidylate kinase-like family protein [Desulfuromonadales bacterium]|nr:cytidylate kinase-like family protein [Desulfuromonadales bacterium]